MTKKYKMRDVFSKDYVDGFEQAIKMCNKICSKYGYKIKFPDINELKVEDVRDNE